MKVVEPWAALVLAAGESRRMGESKPLLSFGDTNVIGWIIDVAREATLAPILVVVGHRAAEVAAALPADACRVDNPAYATGGMFSSVCCGLQAVPREAPAVVLFLGDHPTLDVDVVDSLRAAWRSDGCPDDRFYAPTFDGDSGHPLVIPRSFVAPICEWRGPNGLRGFLHEHRPAMRYVPAQEPGILMDVDEPADYQRALQWLRDRSRRGGGQG